MHRVLPPIAVAATLAAISTLTLTDPTFPDGEAALLGRRPAGVVSNLHFAGTAGPVSADRALLGRPVSSPDDASTALSTIRLRSGRGDGAGALLGR